MLISFKVCDKKLGCENLVTGANGCLECPPPPPRLLLVLVVGSIYRCRLERFIQHEPEAWSLQ